MDEDGDLAHEFYQEKRVRNKKGVVRWTMQRVNNAHLMPQVSISIMVILGLVIKKNLYKTLSFTSPW